MVKIVEEGAFRAKVDLTDFDDVKIEITMVAPLHVGEYRADMSRWNWEQDVAKEIGYLRQEVDRMIHHEYWKMQRAKEREAACAAS